MDMRTSLTIQDVVADIEFEIMQGIISMGDLGQGIQKIKDHQNNIRQQLLDKSTRDVVWREVVNKQFQINEMLVTLLQEVVTHQYNLDQKFKRLGEKRPSLSALSTQEMVKTFQQQEQSATTIEKRKTSNIKSIMSDDMQVQLVVQSSNVPFIGSFINRFKIGLHNLVLFYLRLFAKKQLMVNQTYGDWLLYFNSVNRHGQEEIDILRKRVEQLEKQVS